MKKTIGLILGTILLLSGIASAQTNCWTFNSITGSWVNSCTGTVTPPILAITGKQLTIYNSLGLKATDNQIIDFSSLPNGANKIRSAALSDVSAFQPSGAAINLVGTDTNATTITCDTTGTKTFSVAAGLGFSTDMVVTAMVTANPTTYMLASVNSYTGTTLILNQPTYSQGSYTGKGWTIQVSGPQGPTGATGSGASPAGSMEMFGGSSLPPSYIWADGSCYSTSTYPLLYTAIGTTWNADDGCTAGQYGVPNMKGRIPVGAGLGNTAENGGAGTNRVLGATGGAETHTQSINEMPSHNHTDSGHTHGSTVQPNFVVVGSGAYAYNQGTGSGVFSSSSATAVGYANISYSGGGAPASIMNPFAVVNYIIRYQ